MWQHVSKLDSMILKLLTILMTDCQQNYAEMQWSSVFVFQCESFDKKKKKKIGDFVEKKVLF